MKNILTLLFFIFALGMESPIQAHAFYLQDSIEFSYPLPSPYPPVLSPAIDILPQGYVTINVGDEVYYYCNGIFYQMIMLEQKYVVVAAPIGAVVSAIPSGYQLMLIDGTTYYEFGGVYYKRLLDGYRVTFPPIGGVL